LRCPGKIRQRSLAPTGCPRRARCGARV